MLYHSIPYHRLAGALPGNPNGSLMVLCLQLVWKALFKTMLWQIKTLCYESKCWRQWANIKTSIVSKNLKEVGEAKRTRNCKKNLVILRGTHLKATAGKIIVSVKKTYPNLALHTYTFTISHLGVLPGNHLGNLIVNLWTINQNEALAIKTHSI